MTVESHPAAGLLSVRYALKQEKEVSIKHVFQEQEFALYEVRGQHIIYRVSQEECARLREGVPYVKAYRYNPKHLCPKLNGYGDNGQRSLKL